MPPGPAATGNRLQRYRNEVKRFRIGEAANQDVTATKTRADLLIHAAMHDQCRSGIRHLVRPLVSALGHHPVQAAIVDYMRTGSDPEKIGATMAWYAASPGVSYASMEDLGDGVPTPESRATLDALSDLRAEYRAACLTSFLACDDPMTRQHLSFGLHLDPAAYPEHLRNSHEQAMGIVRADPEVCVLAQTFYPNSLGSSYSSTPPKPPIFLILFRSTKYFIIATTRQRLHMTKSIQTQRVGPSS
jgi:hypothetical protein